MKTLVKFLLLITICLSWTAIALSQTPDDVTPAEETVCDDAGLSGALWGLCNAYCEAMDCDSDVPNASEKACNRIFDKFISKSGGKEPPCFYKPSPCEIKCDRILEKELALCQYEYEIGMKKCLGDPDCEARIEAIFYECTNIANEGHDNCISECSPCEIKCETIRNEGYEECYTIYDWTTQCKPEDSECIIKIKKELQVCLDGVDNEYELCIKGCGGPIIIIK